MITLFSIPKAFEGHNGVIQRNAIRSWKRLGDGVQVILMGNDAGTREAAEEFGCTYVGDLGRNEYGTPRLDDAFRIAHEKSTTNHLCYVNADIILPEQIVTAATKLADRFERFLAVGRRWDIEITEEIDSADELLRFAEKQRQADGHLHASTGMDFFLFSKANELQMPPFVVGRPAWDNWTVYSAKAANVPVIDLTKAVEIFHQDHDYGHVANATRGWEGPEANYNRLIADQNADQFDPLQGTVDFADWKFGKNWEILPISTEEQQARSKETMQAFEKSMRSDTKPKIIYAAHRFLPAPIVNLGRRCVRAAVYARLLLDYNLTKLRGIEGPPPHFIKQKKILRFANMFGIQTFVETGTFKGHMIEAMADKFGEIYSIELSEELHDAAKQKFADAKHVNLILGDSKTALPVLLEKLDKPCLFWLDGHYSGAGTAKGDTDTPVKEEIEAILAHPLSTKHVVIIDDARAFRGKNSQYPTIDSVRDMLAKGGLNQFSLKDDMMVAYKS